MARPHRRNPLFSLAPVQFRTSAIAGRGVFARQPFKPGEVVVAYAPTQQRIDAQSAEAVAAARSKLTLLSERHWVIIPDTRVPGGWLCNHSCYPNAALHSDGEGRIQCVRPIRPGEEVTIFYGWVTENEPGRDPCHCGNAGCRGTINFDVTDDDVQHIDGERITSEALHARLADYEAFLESIGQEHVIRTIADTISRMRERLQRA